MEFNITKCVVLRCSRSPTPFQHDYRLNDHVLDIKDEHPYLGITLHKSLSWTSHISKISTKASQTFNFLRRNLRKCSASIKTSAYLTLVRPIMEYAVVAWDPHQCNNIQTLEEIQCRADCWVMNDYNRYSSVSDMLHNLNWQPLQLRHRISRLQMFYAAVHNTTALSIPQRFLQQVIQPETIINITILSPVHEPTPIKPHFIQELLKIGTNCQLIYLNATIYNHFYHN